MIHLKSNSTMALSHQNLWAGKFVLVSPESWFSWPYMEHPLNTSAFSDRPHRETSGEQRPVKKKSFQSCPSFTEGGRWTRPIEEDGLTLKCPAPPMQETPRYFDRSNENTPQQDNCGNQWKQWKGQNSDTVVFGWNWGFCVVVCR